MPPVRTIALLLALSPGCSCDPADVDDDLPDAGDDADPGGPVTGSKIDARVTVAGVVDDPDDLSSAVIEALIPEGDGYRRIAGTGAADGTFAIDHVPAGRYLLRVDDLYILTSARDIDLGTNRLGRADGVESQLDTEVTVDVQGMTAWQTGDSLDLYVPNSDAQTAGLELSLEPPPADDDVAIDATFDFATQVFPEVLIDSGAGDEVVVIHRTVEVDGVESYNAATEVFEPAPLAMTDGQPVTLDGSFSPLAVDQSVEVSLPGAAWQALVPGISIGTPGEELPSISLFASPFATDRGDLGAIFLAEYAPPDAGDHSFTLSYGNPFDTGFVSETVGIFVINELGGTPATLAFGFAGAADVAGALLPDAAPRIGPVASLQVDGADATAPQTISTAPEISWSAPAIGSADSYTVRINEADGGLGTPVASLITTETRIVIPDALLRSGGVYYVQILAHDDDIDQPSAPFRRTTASSNDSARPSALLTVE
jgi:hypothetical protein